MRAALIAFFMVALAGPAFAENCTRSRDYILTSPDDLPQKPKVYQELFRQCLETMQMSNVKDAFVLRTGAVAVVPRRDTVAATANTLAQFCTRFPNGTLHFIAHKDLPKTRSMTRAVRLSSARATPCRKIVGNP